ncbi:MAG: hypothetical protein ACXVH6_04455 [Halobacteriota archaeon]
MDLRQPGSNDARITIADLENGPAALVSPISPGDIVTLKANLFDFEVEVESVKDGRYEGKIVESPYEHLAGRSVGFYLSHVWHRRVR